MANYVVKFQAEEEVLNGCIAIVDAETRKDAYDQIHSIIKESGNPFATEDCAWDGVNEVTVEVTETKGYTDEGYDPSDVIELEKYLEDRYENISTLVAKIEDEIANGYKKVNINLDDVTVEPFSKCNIEHLKILHEGEIYFLENSGPGMAEYIIEPSDMCEVKGENEIDGLSLVIKYKDKVIGYVSFSVYVDDEDFDYLNTIEISAFYITKRFRGHGIYHHVLKSEPVKDLQKEYPNYRIVTWNSVKKQDFVKHKEKLGFKVEKEIRNLYGEGFDGVQMVRENTPF